MSSKNTLMIFHTEQHFLEALHRLERQYPARVASFSPCDLRHASDFCETETPFNIVKVATLCGAILGLITGAIMVWYSAVIDTPLNVGGKPLNSWPVSIPLMWILAVLFAGLAGFASFIWRLRFPQFYNPIFDFPEFELHKDRFYISLSPSVSAIELSDLEAQIVEGTTQ